VDGGAAAGATAARRHLRDERGVAAGHEVRQLPHPLPVQADLDAAFAAVLAGADGAPRELDGDVALLTVGDGVPGQCELVVLFAGDRDGHLGVQLHQACRRVLDHHALQTLNGRCKPEHRRSAQVVTVRYEQVTVNSTG
jgi:hypothetical protein